MRSAHTHSTRTWHTHPSMRSAHTHSTRTRHANDMRLQVKPFEGEPDDTVLVDLIPLLNGTYPDSPTKLDPPTHLHFHSLTYCVRQLTKPHTCTCSISVIHSSTFPSTPFTCPRTLAALISSRADVRKNLPRWQGFDNPGLEFTRVNAAKWEQMQKSGRLPPASPPPPPGGAAGGGSAAAAQGGAGGGYSIFGIRIY
jgi:hypothetical protein